MRRVPVAVALIASAGVASAEPAAGAGDVRDLLASKERVSAVVAVELLGADDLEVFRPSTARDLAASLRTVYVDGGIVPEYALEVSPWHLWVGPRVSYRDYLASAVHPILQRTSLSLATTSRSVAGADVTFGALGARVKIVDRTDWRLDRARVGCILAQAQLPGPPTAPGDDLLEDGGEPSEADIERAFAACEQGARWNAAQWSVDAAISSAFPGGDPRWDIHDAAVSTVFVAGVADWLRLGGGARYTFADTRLDDDGRQPAKHVLGAGATVEARQERWGLLVDFGAGYRVVDDPGPASDDAGLLLASAELQVGLTADTWLSLRVGADAVLGGDDGALSLATLHWNLETLPSRKE